MLAQLLEQEALGCSVDGKMILIEATGEKQRETGDGATATDVRALLRKAFA
jgi:hypothetical protein